MRHLGLETFVLGRVLDTTLQEKVIGIPNFGNVSVLELPQDIFSDTIIRALSSEVDKNDGIHPGILRRSGFDVFLIMRHAICR